MALEILGHILPIYSIDRLYCTGKVVQISTNLLVKHIKMDQTLQQKGSRPY